MGVNTTKSKSKGEHIVQPPASGTPVTQPTPEQERLSRLLNAGAIGTVAGTGLGLLHAALTGGNYLRDTLAGALIGGAGGAGTSYMADLGPFASTNPIVTGLASARDRFMQTLLTNPEASPTEAARGALLQGVLTAATRQGEFTPEERKALAEQFVKARTPTGQGWRRRVNLLEQASNTLMAQPVAAAPQLSLLQRVAPDNETRVLAGEALARIRSGEAATPEGRHALAAIAKSLQSKLPLYRKATDIFDAMAVMKDLYARGQLTEETVAKNLGLLTGRFGDKTPEIEQLRQLVQQTLARPIERPTQAPYGAGTPASLASLISRAMSS